jgi:hypothetical protein
MRSEPAKAIKAMIAPASTVTIGAVAGVRPMMALAVVLRRQTRMDQARAFAACEPNFRSPA